MEKVEFIIDKSKKEGIQDEIYNNFLPSHFFYAICGKPGSGKTTLLKKIMSDSNFLYKKFDFVFILSPSNSEFNGFFLPKWNVTSNLNFEWIQERINYINKNYSNEYINVLIIFDDLIAQINKENKNDLLLSFVLNRRHLIHKGMISILMTAQRYKLLPTNLRANLTAISFFKLSNKDYKDLKDEIADTKIKMNKVYKILNKVDNSFVHIRIDSYEYFVNFDKIV